MLLGFEFPNFFECCGTIFVITIVYGIIFTLYLKKKDKLSWKFRSFCNNDDAVLVISRLFAIGIPLILVTIFHVMNALEMGVWSPLLSISIGLAIVLTGAVIAVLGMIMGLWKPFLLILVIWVLCVYFYFQFETNII